MRMAVFAFGVVAAVVLQCAAAQRAYVVGDSNLGWTIPPNGAETYVSWASNKNFMVDDVLSKYCVSFHLLCFPPPPPPPPQISGTNQCHLTLFFSFFPQRKNLTVFLF